MKSLFDFINEAAYKEDPNATLDKKDGKEAKPSKNTKAEWGVNEPTDDEVLKPVKWDKESLTTNTKKLLKKFKSNRDFMILGEAGWGKTSIIEDMAKKFGMDVVTVYLDKAVATDLGGIPVPLADQRRGAKQKVLPPDWANVIIDNPDKKFLLFFDEMNQAAPDVMNALMPIVLKHTIAGVECDNILVGAAGNFEYENGAVNELSGPLESRFKPIIIWQSGTDEEWGGAFAHLHKKWDATMGKEFIDKLHSVCKLFNNPREVERGIIEATHNLLKDGDYDMFDASDFAEDFEALSKGNLSRTEKQDIQKLGEFVYQYLHNGGKTSTSSSAKPKKRNDISMVPDTIIDAIKNGITQGYIQLDDEPYKGIKFGVSKENIFDIIDQSDCNAEMIQRIIDREINNGAKWKFTKDSQWKKAGYIDANDYE